jgi:hypothetical protein
MTVIVSSVIGRGPLSDEPAAAELLPAAVLAAPAALLTAPTESIGMATTPSVACPDAVTPNVTALLAWVLAALAFCALSAAVAIEKLLVAADIISATVNR